MSSSATEVRVPYVALASELAREAVREAVTRQLASGSYILGAEVERFEQRFALLAGAPFALGLNSGTDALFLALRALGVGPGDEVLTVSNSFVASAGAIAQCGARPVFVDVGPDYQMDPAALERAIGPRTRAVVPVHLTGAMADMPRIMELARARGLFVVEDAAQAVGASLAGRGAGTWGDAGAFSLHPLKNLCVAGDGGMLVTASPGLRDKVQLLRNHGLRTRDDAQEFGINSRLDALQAAIGNAVLDRLAEITRRRQENAARYDRLLGDLAPDLLLPPRRPDATPVFHLYVVQCERRDELARALLAAGIETRVHYPVPIHLQGAGRALGHREGDLPETERQSRRILSLPIHQHLVPAQQELVAATIRAFYGR